MISRFFSRRRSLRLCAFARGQKQRAFTLIELIFVLAIICIALAVIAPEFSGFLRGQSASNAANKLVALARHGRSLAITEGRAYRLNVDSSSGEFWLEAQEGADFKALGTSNGQHFQLPDGTKVTWLNETGAEVVPTAANAAAPASSGSAGSFGLSTPLAAGANGGPNKAASAAQGVQFFPDGRCETLSLKLVAKSGVEIQLGAPSETEMWRIVKEGQL